MDPERLFLHHCTSLPAHFFGRTAELALLDGALGVSGPSVVAFVGPGGQGKTAIVQHWLEGFLRGTRTAEGLFLWSFYRGKDSDLCLRTLYSHVCGASVGSEVAASFCVDRLVPALRARPWVVILDGIEVVQYESGEWFGRLIHPELSRLVEELATETIPGVVVVTSRFPLPDLARRRQACLVSLGSLDVESSRALLRSLRVQGEPEALDRVRDLCGGHAKAVELLGTYLVRFRGGIASMATELPPLEPLEGASQEEERVARVLAAYGQALAPETCDLLALATAFRDPPTPQRLIEYLKSEPVRHLLKDTWKRDYDSFADRPQSWIEEQLQELVALRLLERLGRGVGHSGEVIDAHPLVRRSFEHRLGASGRREGARARAGFLHGRPDRKRPDTLEEAREEIELFHAYCDAGLWAEADAAYAALDRPRYRFVAPGLDRDLLLRFFPQGNPRNPPYPARFRRWRELAVDLEMLGQFEEAIALYPPEDAPLRGDALLALGDLTPLLPRDSAPHPWRTVWDAYRAHALCLAGRRDEALTLVRTLVPVDIYEWTHVFECLLRAGRLDLIDMNSFLSRPADAGGHRWADLARARMRADALRVRGLSVEETIWTELLTAYDQGGLPWERSLVRLSYGRWLIGQKRPEKARLPLEEARILAQRHAMRIQEIDALELSSMAQGTPIAETEPLRAAIGYHGPARP